MNARQITTFLTTLILGACGGPKSQESPAPAPAAPASPTGPSAESPDAAAAAQEPQAPDPTTVVAKIALISGERRVTFGEVAAWAESRRAAPEAVRWPMTFDDYVGRLLLADEASRKGMTEPADEVLRADAWAKQELAPTAESSVTDADLQASFAERRSAVRVMTRSLEEAQKLREALLPKVAEAQAMPDKIKVFKTRGGSQLQPGLNRDARDEQGLAPQGALFDGQGKGDAGQSVVPEKIAAAAFKLTNEGDISEAFELATGRFAIVMLTGVRPGTPLEKVPPEVRERAKTGLVASRAMTAMKERVARLRREAPVTVLDERLVVRALGLDEDAIKAARMRKVPFDLRKMRADQLRGGEGQRIPGVEPRRTPPERVNPERIQEDMQK